MSIQYSIDSTDHIRFINEAWLQFACQNDGAHLSRAYVIGKSLWEFIDGEDNRQVHRLILKTVRATQRVQEFKFRCDSPVCRRHFLLTVSPLPEGELMFSTHPVREDSRSPVPLLDPDVKRGEQYLRICSWCIKACLPNQKWVELEDAISLLGLLCGGIMPNVTHGVCPDCQITIEKELKNLK